MEALFMRKFQKAAKILSYSLDIIQPRKLTHIMMSHG